jgi:hypothetical protein
LSDVDIGRLEGEVETARAKLVKDLSRLRSPATFDDFTESARHVIVDKVKTGTQSSWHDIVENLKARAAENPAATLAIGAGLAWRLLRHPPIATALIGTGLFSLLRTPPAGMTGNESGDYISHAKERLKEQATEFADGVADRASDIASELKYDGGAVAEAVRDQSAQLAGAVKDKAQEWAAKIGDATREVPDRAASLARQAARSREYVQAPEARDNVLLGIAGVAVLAALGAVYQRRNAGFETPPLRKHFSTSD